MRSELVHVLTDVRRTYRRAVGVEGVFRLLATVLAGLGGLFLLDNLVVFPWPLRVAGLCALLIAAVWVARSRLTGPLGAARSADGMAILIERRHPGLENRLINALQISRSYPEGGGFVDLLQEDAVRAVRACDTDRVVDRRGPRRALAVAGAVAGLLLAYCVLFPVYFWNAADRFSHPMRYVPPVTMTRIAVEPGDAKVLLGTELVVRAQLAGEVPATAQLVVEGSDGEQPLAMDPAPGGFLFRFQSVSGPFRYYVAAGDARTVTFQVEVLRIPTVERLVVEYRYPEVYRLPPRVEEAAAGPLAAPRGTQATLTGLSTQPLESAAIFVDGMEEPLEVLEDGRTFTAALTVQRDTLYALRLRGLDGAMEEDPPRHPVRVQPDDAPRAAFREPQGEWRGNPDRPVAVVVEAADDFGLVGVELRARGASGEVEVLASWAPDRPERRARLPWMLDPTAHGWGRGDEVTLVAAARDALGQETVSAEVRLTFQTEAKERRERMEDLRGAITGIRELLERQQTAVAHTQRTQGLSGKGQDADAVVVAAQLPADQEAIVGKARELLDAWAPKGAAERDQRRRLADLSGDAMVRAVLAARHVIENGDLAANLDALLVVQNEIVAALKDILGETGRVLADVRAGREESAGDEGERTAAEDLLRKLLEEIKEFRDEQKQVIVETEKLRDQGPENWDRGDEAELEAMKDTEENWGEVFAGLHSDLSKLPPQDFSDASILQEILETYSELENAAEAMEKKETIELAVPYEQSGLELAEELTANIEKWLADSHDNVKWDMEEPDQDFDVPLSELPEELEDIIGDVIDSEENMTEEAEDVTSSWMDSLDKGAGWGVSDGPISNMSARGITGNLQPNSNEVGGRSGEGRQGKSSGQFVQDHAEGRDGNREMPSRSTDDPYEQGDVEDSYTGPTGGSTGGGKDSGAGQEGLRGTPPPETMEKMKKLAAEQAGVRSQAERLDYGLQRRGVHSEDLGRAVDLMREMEGDLRRYVGSDYEQRRREIVEKLTVARKAVGEEVERMRDESAALPRELREQLRSAMGESSPEEYRSLLEAYYRALSEGR